MLDMAQTRLAYSMLSEAVLSVRVLNDPSRHAVHLPWLRHTHAWMQESALDLGLLSDLVPADDRIPDFLTPPPATPVPVLNQELERLRAVPVTQVRKDLDAMVVSRSNALASLYADPADGLNRLSGQITAYWEGAIGPYWPRMRALLDGDILYRARRITEGGADLVLRDLHPDVAWKSGELSVSRRRYHDTRSVRDRGLLLVPSVFAWPAVFTQTEMPWQPTLIYPVRGVGTLWEEVRARTPMALAKVLGHSRARLLAQLDTPATTTDLARIAGMTAGGASQHLTALRDAGMITAQRDGRFTLYTRTALGNAIIAAQSEPMPPHTPPTSDTETEE
nr:putative transcriptional regulator [Kibdelosporangium sp. MJ126-NF4]